MVGIAVGCITIGTFLWHMFFSDQKSSHHTAPTPAAQKMTQISGGENNTQIGSVGGNVVINNQSTASVEQETGRRIQPTDKNAKNVLKPFSFNNKQHSIESNEALKFNQSPPDPEEKVEPVPQKDSPGWPAYQARQHLRKPEKLTLYDLFLTDFSGSQMIGRSGPVNTPDGQIKIEYFFIIDLERRSKLLEFYIPWSHHTSDLCIDISDLINSQILTLPKDADVNISQKGIGDSNVSTSNEAIFSGRVFIYHETELLAEEIGDLTKLYKTKNLAVQFRSTSYLSFKKMRIEADN